MKAKPDRSGDAAAIREYTATSHITICRPGRAHGLGPTVHRKVRPAREPGRPMAVPADTAERDATVLAHDPLVRRTAAQWRRKLGCHIDDLVQTGAEAALRAWPDWQPEKGSFGTFAKPVISRAVAAEAIRSLSVVRGAANDVELDAPREPSAHDPEDAPPPATLGDTLTRPPGGDPCIPRAGCGNHEEDSMMLHLDRPVRVKRIRSAVVGLPLRTRHVLYCRFQLGMTLQETASHVSTSAQNVWQLQQRALTRLRAYAEII